jgi:hypothetical protein
MDIAGEINFFHREDSVSRFAFTFISTALEVEVRTVVVHAVSLLGD